MKKIILILCSILLLSLISTTSDAISICCGCLGKIPTEPDPTYVWEGQYSTGTPTCEELCNSLDQDPQPWPNPTLGIDYLLECSMTGVGAPEGCGITDAAACEANVGECVAGDSFCCDKKPGDICDAQTGAVCESDSSCKTGYGGLQEGGWHYCSCSVVTTTQNPFTTTTTDAGAVPEFSTYGIVIAVLAILGLYFFVIKKKK